MEKEVILTKTYIINDNLMDTVKQLLSEGWRKRKAQVFYKERNHFIIEFNGQSNPIWILSVTPKTNEFDLQDWKLLQDIRKLKYLGKNLNQRKKLYFNDNNRAEIRTLIKTMRNNKFNLIFDNNYIVFRTKEDKVKVFKIAASMDLVEQHDGWYVGQKKIL